MSDGGDMATESRELAAAYRSLDRWNNERTPYPRHLRSHELFEEWVDRTPNAVALVVGEERLSYRELDNRANRFAHYLRKKGAGPNDYVGICLHRSVELVVSILGVLKAGATYVALDASYPEMRLRDMMTSVPLTGVVMAEGLAIDDATGAAWRVAGGELMDLSEDMPSDRPARVGSPDSLAYLVFTSGSTGKAKATKVKHQGWTNLLHWFRTHYSIGDSDRVLVVSSFSFDITQRSIMMPLVSGGELHLLASRFFEPELILRNVERREITIVNSAPSMFYAILEWPARRAGALSSLRWVFLGGEPIVAGRLTAWVNGEDCNARIANVYGVAECSDVSAAYTLVDFDRYSRTSVPLGVPIFNSSIYLLNEDGKEVPVGEIGEICIGGDGVGLGYEGDEALTGERFVPDRFRGDPDAVMYRSGDLGRIGPDLNLEYHGRVDQQVKISGVRVELGDVEAAIRSHSGIKDVVVVQVRGRDDMSLIAYVVCAADVDTTDFGRTLREYLRGRLPSPMLPSRVEFASAMPLNPNGKVDRRAIAALFARDAM
jgi:D-alanine--poly(phosphoribitol) ligase subunit 1